MSALGVSRRKQKLYATCSCRQYVIGQNSELVPDEETTSLAHYQVIEKPCYSLTSENTS